MKNINAVKSGVRCALCILLALVMLALSACNTAPAESSKPTEAETDAPVMVKAVRAKESAMAGTGLGVTGVELVDLDKSTLPEGYLTKVTDIAGRKLLVDVAAGDIITEAMLEAKSGGSGEGGDGENNVNTESARERGYVVVTDLLEDNRLIDVSDGLQKIIDENPGATIYFPDGIYTITKPIKTSSDPEKAVSLYLSNFAIIRAANEWNAENGHMIRLGALDAEKSVDSFGTSFYMHGGIVDGNGMANGVSIEGGRGTSIRYVSMKSVKQGLHITKNAGCESSDVDLQTVNIVGCQEKDSVGILVDGYDNTLTNMRVAGFQVACKVNGARNTFRNLHMLWTYNDAKYDYEDSVGFYDTSEGNRYDICYPDNFAVGFLTSSHTVSVYNNCYAYWYSNRDGETQIGFKSEGKFNSIIKHYRVDLRDEKVAKFLVVGEAGGTGIVEYPIFPEGRNEDDSYKDYLVGRVIWSS
ncbi:MAG: hypothetical protein E7642_03980 [Ruminococcaceae bacterium]|nr:hypothetical protein [Oscillospiraceae bacterium]